MNQTVLFYNKHEFFHNGKGIHDIIGDVEVEILLVEQYEEAIKHYIRLFPHFEIVKAYSIIPSNEVTVISKVRNFKGVF